MDSTDVSELAPVELWKEEGDIDITAIGTRIAYGIRTKSSNDRPREMISDCGSRKINCTAWEFLPKLEQCLLERT